MTQGLAPTRAIPEARALRRRRWLVAGLNLVTIGLLTAAMVALMRKHHPCRLHDGSECEGPTTDCDPGNCRAVRDVIEKEMANVG